MSATPKDDGTVKLISPQDYRVYRVPAAQADAYRNAGYVAPQTEINPEEVHSHFNGWSGAGKSFMYSVVNGVPFAKTAIAGVSDQEQAQAWQESFDAAAREHPVLDFAGKTLGLVGGVAGATALGTAAAGGIAGLAGVGAAAGVEAAGAGAAAEAGALGLGAEAATAAGAGAEAAGGAGSAAAAAARSLGSKSILGAMGKGAAANAALGAVARVDDAALAHAADPEGKEKIFYDMNGSLWDAALGAALPGALGGASKALGWIGKNLGASGMKAMQSALTKAGTMDAVERQGRMGDVRSKLEEIIREGRKDPKMYAKNRVKIAGSAIEDVKSDIDYAKLGPMDTQAIKNELRTVLGRKDRLYRRITEHLGEPQWGIDEMQKLNEKIYAEIVFDEPSLVGGANARYMSAAEKVKNGMLKLVGDHDLTPDKSKSQKFASAMKEYSDWALTHSAVKGGQSVKGVGELLSDMASGAATSAATGYLFGSFGGAGAAAAGGAGYKAVKGLTAFHYGKAAEMLGKVFQATDRKLAQAVEAGLYGTPALLHKSSPGLNYQDLASKLSAARQDPQKSFENIRVALHDANVPDDMADEIALSQHTVVQHLASKLPSRTTAPDVASRGQGDPVQQRRLVGMARTAQDPTYGLANPTRTNLEILQQFYPNVLHNAQQATLSQLQRNPDMPAASKRWASRVLGRPINNLSSPNFSAILASARQQAEQVAQQGQGGTPSPRKTGSQQASPATRFDELQGGA